MTREEKESCICTINTLRRLALNIHGVIDVVDDANCSKLIELLKQEPCEDCVSRQAVLKMAYDMSEIDGEHFTEPCMVVNVEDIQKLSSVQPKAKVGKWISIYGNVKCSVCGNVKDGRSVGKATHYCDFCGAKMESEE